MSLTLIPTPSTVSRGDCARVVALNSANNATKLFRNSDLIESLSRLRNFGVPLLALEQICKAAVKDAALRIVMMILRAIDRTMPAEINDGRQLHRQHRRGEINPQSSPK